MFSWRWTRDFSAWWVQRAPFAIVENPFELLIAIFCIAGGVPYILGDIRSGSVDSLLPRVLVLAWGAQLLLGGVLTTIGLMLRKRLIERAGLWPLGAASAIYALSILYEAGIRGIVASLITGAFSIACLSRLMLLHAAERILKKADEVSRDGI